jgi:hypothetical protein
MATSEACDLAEAGKASFERRNPVSGKAGIAELTDLRWIGIETVPQRYPF